jgi:SAM-dependent methyltransferase
MNWFHRRLCKSPRWAKLVEDVIVPATLGERELGDDALEIGPGYGATTGPLAARAGRLTALEIDPVLAERLADRYAGVEVVQGDGADMPFESDRFSAAFCATMLHHVPSPALQDRLFVETHRVLRPGAWFLGADSLPSWRFRLIHIGDTMVTVDPATLPDRLRAAGFVDVKVRAADGALRFMARKPTPAAPADR